MSEPAPLRIAMAGAGRMGQAIMSAIGRRDDVVLASVWQRAAALVDTGGAPGSDDIEAVVAEADVVVDFSLPDGTVRVVEACKSQSKPLVCGVSGLGEEQFALLDEASRTIPIVYDRNMSQGIAVLQSLVRRAVAALDGFEVTIGEVHHVHKKDAPSGTALKLGEAVAAARGRKLEDLAWYGADTAEPRPGQIRFDVERRGEVPGEHTLKLSSATETLTLGHSVTTRGVFADGALRAALWLSNRPAGLYDMGDVLTADA